MLPQTYLHAFIYRLGQILDIVYEKKLNTTDTDVHISTKMFSVQRFTITRATDLHVYGDNMLRKKYDSIMSLPLSRKGIIQHVFSAINFRADFKVIAHLHIETFIRGRQPYSIRRDDLRLASFCIQCDIHLTSCNACF